MTALQFSVRRVPAAQTLLLRQQVLRPHQRPEDLRLPGDDDPDTAFFAALTGPATALGDAAIPDRPGTGDLLVATGNVRPEPVPPAYLEAYLEAYAEGHRATPILARDAAVLPGWRIRGMATQPVLRGQGAGTLVLAACLEHAGRHGGGLVWCHARVPALALYRRAGFVAVTEPWDDPQIGPHVALVCPVLVDGHADAGSAEPPGRR